MLWIVESVCISLVLLAKYWQYTIHFMCTHYIPPHTAGSRIGNHAYVYLAYVVYVSDVCVYYMIDIHTRVIFTNNSHILYFYWDTLRSLDTSFFAFSYFSSFSSWNYFQFIPFHSLCYHYFFSTLFLSVSFDRAGETGIDIDEEKSQHAQFNKNLKVLCSTD